jgi:hypothetical protein
MSDLAINPANAVGGDATIRIDLTCARALGSDRGPARRVPPFISKSQAYYWTRAWQEGEAEALAEIAAGEGRVFNDPHELARYLLSSGD